MKPAAHLDVDVVFTVLDHMHVGFVDGLLVVLYTCGPIRRRAKHLTHKQHRCLNERLSAEMSRGE